MKSDLCPVIKKKKNGRKEGTEGGRKEGKKEQRKERRKKDIFTSLIQLHSRPLTFSMLV